MRTVLSMILALFVALISLPAYAAPAATDTRVTTQLPTSDEVISKKWLRMNPTTFPVGNASVLEQYDRAAKLDSRLTLEKRARLATMLQMGQGVVVSMPDGICLDWLTGRFEGSPFVYSGMCKALGRDDRALMYELGDGVTIYWFTGIKGQSCNNIGIVIKKKPPAPNEPNEPAKPKKLVCQTVYVQKRSEPTQGVFISSLYLVDCCCDVLYTPSLYLPGGSQDNMTIAYQVCS